MNATATRAPPKAAKAVKPYRVEIDSPLAPRISVNVEAGDEQEARRIVLGWIDSGTRVREIKQI